VECTLTSGGGSSGNVLEHAERGQPVLGFSAASPFARFDRGEPVEGRKPTLEMLVSDEGLKRFLSLIPVIPFASEKERSGETTETPSLRRGSLVTRLNTGYYRGSVGFIHGCGVRS